MPAAGVAVVHQLVVVLMMIVVMVCQYTYTCAILTCTHTSFDAGSSKRLLDLVVSDTHMYPERTSCSQVPEE
jgi:hypothetical protein